MTFCVLKNDWSITTYEDWTFVLYNFFVAFEVSKKTVSRAKIISAKYTKNTVPENYASAKVSFFAPATDAVLKNPYTPNDRPLSREYITTLILVCFT